MGMLKTSENTFAMKNTFISALLVEVDVDSFARQIILYASTAYSGHLLSRQGIKYCSAVEFNEQHLCDALEYE